MTEEKKNFINAMMIYLKSINAPQNQWLNYSCHVQLGYDSITQKKECLTVGIPEVPFNKWISVKDQLPPFDEIVLVKYKEKINVGKLRMSWEISQGYPYGSTEPEMKNSGAFWMPLPNETTE